MDIFLVRQSGGGAHESEWIEAIYMSEEKANKCAKKKNENDGYEENSAWAYHVEKWETEDS